MADMCSRTRPLTLIDTSEHRNGQPMTAVCSRCRSGPRLDQPLFQCSVCRVYVHTSCYRPAPNKSNWVCLKCSQPLEKKSRYHESSSYSTFSSKHGLFFNHHDSQPVVPDLAPPSSKNMEREIHRQVASHMCRFSGCTALPLTTTKFCLNHQAILDRQKERKKVRESREQEPNRERPQNTASPTASQTAPMNSRLLPEFEALARSTMRKSARSSSLKTSQSSPTSARLSHNSISPSTTNPFSQNPRPLNPSASRLSSDSTAPGSKESGPGTYAPGRVGSSEPFLSMHSLASLHKSPKRQADAAGRSSQNGPTDFSLHPRKRHDLSMTREPLRVSGLQPQDLTLGSKDQRSASPRDSLAPKETSQHPKPRVETPKKATARVPDIHTPPIQIVESFHNAVEDWYNRKKKSKETVGTEGTANHGRAPNRFSKPVKTGQGAPLPLKVTNAALGDNTSSDDAPRFPMSPLKRKRDTTGSESSVPLFQANGFPHSRPTSSRSSLLSSESSSEERPHPRDYELHLELLERQKRKNLVLQGKTATNETLGISEPDKTILPDILRLRQLQALEEGNKVRNQTNQGKGVVEENTTNAAQKFTYMSPIAMQKRKQKWPTCEERRRMKCNVFDSAKFDAMIYSQHGAAPPPPGIQAPTREQGPTPAPGEDGRMYLNLDPRIHWPHNRSDAWYKRKMEEIKARGGRKANFGQVAKRMHQQRLDEEAEERAYAAAVKAGRPPPRKDPEPWAHNRHMDFGDVPENKLPDYVKENPAWMRACAWMRDNRGKSLERARVVAALQAGNEPWQHMLGLSGL